MICKNCGQDNPHEASFCARCGAVLAAAVEPATQTVATQPAVEYAGFGIRLIAFIIDALIVGAVVFLLGFRSFFHGLGLFSPFNLSSPLLIMSWLYYWLFTRLRGQTPGKMAVRIKVVDRWGNKPGLGTAAMREILGKFISSLFLFLGFLWIIWNRERRGWHDIIAGTRIVKVSK